MPDDDDSQQPGSDAGNSDNLHNPDDDRLQQLERMQAMLLEEFQAISAAGDSADAGSYSGGSRPAGAAPASLLDTEENEMASGRAAGGASPGPLDLGGGYQLYSAHAGSGARGDSSNTPPAYTAGDQPGSMAGRTGNTGITGSDVVQSVFEMLTGGPAGLIAGIEGLFGGDSNEPANLTRYAMPADMQFSGTTTGGTSEDSFASTYTGSQARGASPGVDTDAGTGAAAAPSGAPGPEWIQQNASAIADAVNSQI